MEQLGRYRILGEIGRGAIGVVYRAYDPNLDMEVALKVLQRERLSDASVVRRFLAEAKALGRLEHPNTVRVFNVDEADGTVYIAMELVEGQSLSEVRERGRLRPEEVAELGAAVAEALEDAHNKGIVHRDVKPGNILIRADGRVKITDFGIAHVETLTATDRTEVGQVLGTPSYMSPEQVKGNPVDGRSDIFSLGIILYELATGRKPFAAETMAAVFFAILSSDAPDPCAVDASVPRQLGDIILRCLQKDPGARFAKAAELAEALRAYLARARPSAGRGAGGGGGRKTLVAAAVALILSAVAGVYWTRQRHAEEDRRPPPSPAAMGTLRVESVPAGAQVFVDGAFQGLAPTSASVSQGKHEVRLTLAGYGAWEAQVRVKEDRETPLSVELAPLDPK